MNEYPFHLENSPESHPGPQSVIAQLHFADPIGVGAPCIPHDAHAGGVSCAASSGEQEHTVEPATFDSEMSTPESFIPSADALSHRINDLRGALRPLFKAQTFAGAQRGLARLFMAVQWIAGYAQTHQLRSAAQLAVSLEDFVSDLHHGHALMDSTTVRTLAHVVDLVAGLARLNPEPLKTHAPVRTAIIAGETAASRELVRGLERGGIKAALYSGSEEAMSAARGTGLDVVIIDLEQNSASDANGVCQALRDAFHSAEPIIMAVNANFGLQALAQGAAADFNEWLSNPVCPSELRLRVLAQILKMRLPVPGLAVTQ